MNSLTLSARCQQTSKFVKFIIQNFHINKHVNPWKFEVEKPRVGGHPQITWALTGWGDCQKVMCVAWGRGVVQNPAFLAHVICGWAVAHVALPCKHFGRCSHLKVVIYHDWILCLTITALIGTRSEVSNLSSQKFYTKFNLNLDLSACKSFFEIWGVETTIRTISCANIGMAAKLKSFPLKIHSFEIIFSPASYAAWCIWNDVVPPKQKLKRVHLPSYHDIISSLLTSYVDSIRAQVATTSVVLFASCISFARWLILHLCRMISLRL